MTAEVFLDSNVLLYACSSAPDDAEKRRVAEDLILSGTFALSAQVLQEFIANALCKPRLGISEGNIDATLQMASLVRPSDALHHSLRHRARGAGPRAQATVPRVMGVLTS
jgi:predicted nucleic acid-binding protein